MAIDGATCTKQEMIDAVYASFRAVSRAGGVSWSESKVRDGYGSEENCLAARSRDKDRSWTELVDDTAWDPYPGFGGFSFLDAIGFRYYLAPAMVRSIQTGEDVGSMTFHLVLPAPAHELRGHVQDKWSMLEEPQRVCVREFLRFMLAHCCDGNEYNEKIEQFVRSTWQAPLDSYWESVGTNDLPQ